MSLHEHYIRCALQQTDEVIRCVRAAWSERESRSPWLCSAAVYFDTAAKELRQHLLSVQAGPFLSDLRTALKNLPPYNQATPGAAEQEGGDT